MTQNKKIVWITGGGTGIGKELAKNFCDRNFRVIISGRRLKSSKMFKNSIKPILFQ